MKNGWLLTIAAAAIPSGAAPAAAQTATGLSVGLEVLDYEYRERDGGATIVFDDGPMVGLDVGYTARIGTELFFSARVAGRTGEIDYRDNGGDQIANVDQSVGQLDLRLVKDVRLPPNATLSPFVGIGHRLVLDESGGRTSTGGNAAYDRDITYSYLPVGATLSIGESARNTLSVSAEYDFVLGSQFKSNLSRIDPVLPDLNLKGRDGRGIQIAATLVRPIGPRRAVEVGPFLRHWQIKESEDRDVTVQGVTLNFREPRNRTTEWGIRAGLRF